MPPGLSDAKNNFFPSGERQGAVTLYVSSLYLNSLTFVHFPLTSTALKIPSLFPGPAWLLFLLVNDRFLE